MSPSLINIFFLLLITPFDLSIAKHCPFGSKYTVYITNKLPSHSPKLTFHCASKNDDLGYHDLAINQVFNWSFCEAILSRTLFFCHFWWGSKEKVFDVFNDPYTCVKGTGNPNILTNCKWEARADGFYLELFNSTSETYYMYHYLEWS
ncbi:hypothetical protein R3W88_025695 [Solanum pinnatisectum]|uniref:S-protein homolog n=1 Tax=Solanum pinnatisectum TaxID=50273 RepID=A0AAV9M5N7_9SOLN|nr:hypothetical protein R3W88_025695 [Solanum pinnatisectum]